MILAALSPDALQWLTVLWLLVLGAAVGSFLNVVVYRLPRGMSVVEPGSHCPICKHPIRWYDNVPVLGWVMLRARCRDCGVRISARYPAVEAITAVLFVAIGVVECFSGGANLPIRPLAVVGGTIGLTPGHWQLAGICAYHLLLLCTLLAIALIDYDGFRVPVRLAVPALAVGLVAPMAWPYLHPVPAWMGLDGWTGGLADGVSGLAVGVLLGLPWWRQAVSARPAVSTRQPGEWKQPGELPALACIGLFLGYQAVVPVVAVALAVHLPIVLLGRVVPILRHIPLTACLAAASLACIFTWPVADRCLLILPHLAHCAG